EAAPSGRAAVPGRAGGGSHGCCGGDDAGRDNRSGRRDHSGRGDHRGDYRRGEGRVMGQKIHPIGFRIGVIRDADSKWYADKQYANLVYEDYKIRLMVKKRKGWDNAAIAKVEIERQANQVKVTLH